jgi:hypothetical protein
MALQESALASALEAIFSEMETAAAEQPKDNHWYAQQVAKAVTDQIKTAQVTGSVTSGAGSGGSVTGSLN